MGKLGVGNVVKALPESRTWMYQYGGVGTITEIFDKDGKSFAKVSVPTWTIKRNHGGHLLGRLISEGFFKSKDILLLLDEGIELTHLELCEMPKPTFDQRLGSFLDQAFGHFGMFRRVHTVSFPKDLLVTPGICDCEGCDQVRTHLAWYNCWGTAVAYMVCEPHYEKLNGVAGDGFPIKAELLRKVA